MTPSAPTRGGAAFPRRAAAEARGPDRASAPQRALKVAGSVVAPAALLTALMYFFGFLHAYYFFGRFGVDYTVMGLTSEDYLVRSQDGLFVPLVAVSAAGLAVLWLGRCLPASVTSRGRRLAGRFVPPAAAVVGVLLLLVAGAGIQDPVLFTGTYALPGLAMAAAVLLFTVASRGRRRTRGAPLPVLVAEWLAIFVLVSVGLFWATTDYSASVGTRRAEQLIAQLAAWPDAVLYSEKSLNIVQPGVREQRCAEPEGAYVYRYDGLKLIQQSGEQLFLLPAAWADGSGSALVLPRTDALRLEFTAPGGSSTGTC